MNKYILTLAVAPIAAAVFTVYLINLDELLEWNFGVLISLEALNELFFAYLFNASALLSTILALKAITAWMNE